MSLILYYVSVHDCWDSWNIVCHTILSDNNSPHHCQLLSQSHLCQLQRYVWMALFLHEKASFIFTCVSYLIFAIAANIKSKPWAHITANGRTNTSTHNQRTHFRGKHKCVFSHLLSFLWKKKRSKLSSHFALPLLLSLSLLQTRQRHLPARIQHLNRQNEKKPLHLRPTPPQSLLIWMNQMMRKMKIKLFRLCTDCL